MPTARRATPHVKPGERAPEAGEYYCYVCAQRGESSTCRAERGQMLVECPHCLERGVFEWDMAWKAESDRPERGASRASPWPAFLGKRS